MDADIALDKMTACLGKLPGIGRKSAERMALSLVRDGGGLLQDLKQALEDAAASVRSCSLCGCVTSVEADPCRLCTDMGREGKLLCVVEDAADVVQIERSGGYRGRYHALMGKMSPMRGVGPDDLRVKKLLDRIEREGIEEVILALSTDVEGDSTAQYLAELLRGKTKTSRLAFGLPAGSGIRYSDSVTLDKAIKGRQEA